MIKMLHFWAFLTLLFVINSHDQLSAGTVLVQHDPQATITVDSLADDLQTNGNCTLREAVLAANLNIPFDQCAAGTETVVPDKILFSVNGTIFLSAALGEIVVTNSLSIEGNGRTNTIIDGGDQNRLFWVTGGLVFALKSLTLQNGRAADNTFNEEGGGAIHNLGAILTLDDVVIQDCYAVGLFELGGAIYTEAGLIINDSLLQNNESDAGGGAIYAFATIIEIDNSIIRNNIADGGTGGGGLLFTQSELTMTDTLVENNTADFSDFGGGGIAGINSFTKPVEISRTLISGNSANGTNDGGGGILCDCGLTLLETTVAHNTALNAEGGGLAGSGSWNIRHSTINDNDADFGIGGGIHHLVGILILTNSTVSHNKALVGGGFLLDGITSIRFSTISSNIATDANQSGSAIFISAVAASVTLTGTILADHEGDFSCYHTGNMTSGGNNILPNEQCGDPLPGDLVGVNARLGPLQDNGGPTFTHALMPDSPAVDYATCLTGVDVDQRYAARPLGSRCDIGAYELWQLSIVSDYPDDAWLSWEPVDSPGCTYDLFESTTPYFTPQGVPSYSNVSSIYVVNGRLGDPTTNFFFINRADCGGEYSIYSNTIGEFDFSLVSGS